MKDERQGGAAPIAGAFREAAGKTTEHVGKILLDLQLEAEGKFEKGKGEVQEKLEDDL